MRQPVSEEGKRLMAMLSKQKIKAGPATPELRKWWAETALPLLKDQMLSELRTYDGFPPKLVGFMKDGTIGVIDVSKATKGMWGNIASKNATAVTHEISARIPSTKGVAFCVETWKLGSNSKGEFDRQLEQ